MLHLRCLQVTQLGHVKDLASAFVKVLGNPAASRQVFNIAGERCGSASLHISLAAVP